MSYTIRDFSQKVRYLMRMGRTELEAIRIAREIEVLPVSHY